MTGGGSPSKSSKPYAGEESLCETSLCVRLVSRGDRWATDGVSKSQGMLDFNGSLDIVQAGTSLTSKDPKILQRVDLHVST
jgi:hypothetical protein